jgi:hypothetical protein
MDHNCFRKRDDAGCSYFVLKQELTNGIFKVEFESRGQFHVCGLVHASGIHNLITKQDLIPCPNTCHIYPQGINCGLEQRSSERLFFEGGTLKISLIVFANGNNKVQDDGVMIIKVGDVRCRSFVSHISSDKHFNPNQKLNVSTQSFNSQAQKVSPNKQANLSVFSFSSFLSTPKVFLPLPLPSPSSPSSSSSDSGPQRTSTGDKWYSDNTDYSCNSLNAFPSLSLGFCTVKSTVVEAEAEPVLVVK